MNHIVNMLIRQVMHQLVRRGMNAGFDQIGNKVAARKSRQNLPPDAIDDYGNPVQPEISREERRQQRQARQQARQARQAAKVMPKVR